jgi:hypothetical protein
MLAYTRGGLAVVERELKKCVDSLTTPVRGTCTIQEAATSAAYALAQAEHALWELRRTIALDENLEAMTPGNDAEIAQAMKDAAE